MYLLLKNDAFLQSIFLRSYHTGLVQWIPIKNLFKGDQFALKINTLKGPADIKSYKLTPILHMNWMTLKFDFFTSHSKRKLTNESTSAEHIEEAECVSCTYQIMKNEYKKCQYCSKVYHKNCIEIENLTPDLKYSCVNCRNCMNCKTSDSQNKIYCIVCNNPYHEGCIHDVIKSTNQLKDP